MEKQLKTTRSIIKDSDRIRTLLKARWTEIDVTATQVVNDAREKGMTFSSASLSKYINYGNVKNTLTEENIMWLCIRYGIGIRLLVGKPVLKEKKLALIVEPYNEQNCLNNLKSIFKTN